MFTYTTKGGFYTLIFFLLIAGVAGFFGFRDNATHGDGAGNFILAAVFLAIGVGAAAWDSRKHKPKA